MKLDAVFDKGPFSNTYSKPHLIKASDGNYYLTKFATDLNLSSIIAEYVCGKLAVKFNLPALEPVVIRFDDDFINNSTQLRAEIQSGPHLGTKFIDNAYSLNQAPIPPSAIMNLNQVPAMISFDVFVDNTDRHAGNSILIPTRNGFNYVLIDHGHCFGGLKWIENTTKDLPYKLSHIPWDKRLIVGLDEFRTPVEKMTRISSEDIRKIVDTMPDGWRMNSSALEYLIGVLGDRSMELMLRCIEDNRAEFPKWGQT